MDINPICDCNDKTGFNACLSSISESQDVQSEYLKNNVTEITNHGTKINQLLLK